MTKGFARKERKPSHVNLEKEIREMIAFFISNPDGCLDFRTKWKRKDVLSGVVNRLALEFKQLFFETYIFDDCPTLRISLHAREREKSSYVWVEKSRITDKWLLMAFTPGAFDRRCLATWKDKDKALKAAKDCFSKVLEMPLIDWNKRKGKYIEVLNSISDDDLSLPGIFDPVTGEFIRLSEQDREAVEEIGERVLSGELPPEELITAFHRVTCHS